MTKSGQSRRRHVSRSKRKNVGRADSSIRQPNAPAPGRETTPRPEAPALTAATRSREVTVAQGIYITKELRRIGILTVIILGVLFVLSRVLS